MKWNKVKFSLLVLLLGSAASRAEPVSIQVNDPQGQPAVGVVVTVSGLPANGKSSASAEMAQRDGQFDPLVLVVGRDTQVSFPNFDSIKHHIYSFSEGNKFDQDVAAGASGTTKIFDQYGVVELGCNIHDWMQGYIYVADTPYFGMTDSSGRIQMDLPAGSAQVKVWHPLIDNTEKGMTQSFDLASNKNVEINLNAAILSAQDDSVDFDDFDY